MNTCVSEDCHASPTLSPRCPALDCNTCFPTRAPPCVRHTTKAGLVWTRHQARIYEQVCAPRHSRGRSPSDDKLDDKLKARLSLRWDEQPTTDMTGEGYLCRRPSFTQKCQTD
ncbi:hypothetical protein DPMN_167546 [Dreissena polymorpha]|uniref:Uncharacterized protein n=1 Tax=Dreissena polymorpha TaxID=45954 RepID=A0A9D4F0I3_DREPO|nr:hypothetical protein DPMN_167546 [Dreissena polymorpha]